MKKMNDKTVVRVRVPKHLYEAIQAKLALKENKEPVKENIQDIVQYLSDPEVYKTLGVVATALGITGGAKVLADKIKKSSTDISGITGAQHGMDESMQDIVQFLSDPEVYKTLGVVATALGITGGAKVLADKIKKSGTDISGITGAEHG